MKKSTQILIGITMMAVIVTGVLITNTTLIKGQIFGNPRTAIEQNKRTQTSSSDKIKTDKKAPMVINDISVPSNLSSNYPLTNLTYKPPVITLDSILKEQIPQSWIDQFNKDFSVSALPVAGLTTEEEEEVINIIYRAIYTVSRIDSYFKKPLPWTNGKSYYEWLKESIKGIALDDSSGSLGTYDYIHIKGGTYLDNIKKGLADQWYNKQMGKGFFDSFIALITHEARHNNGINHTTCPNPKCQPGEVCKNDFDLQEMGAFGVDVIFLHWIKYMLPESITQDAMQDFDNFQYKGNSYLDSICTYDENTGTFGEEDNKWLKNISGYSYGIQ